MVTIQHCVESKSHETLFSTFFINTFSHDFHKSSRNLHSSLPHPLLISRNLSLPRSATLKFRVYLFSNGVDLLVSKSPEKVSREDTFFEDRVPFIQKRTSFSLQIKAFNFARTCKPNPRHILMSAAKFRHDRYTKTVSPSGKLSQLSWKGKKIDSQLSVTENLFS